MGRNTAGRKPSLTTLEINALKERSRAGENTLSLAKAYGVSRQTISKYLNQTLEIEPLDDDARRHRFTCRSLAYWKRMNSLVWDEYRYRDENPDSYNLRVDYMNRDQVCTTILVNFGDRRLMIHNETDDLMLMAFGFNRNPNWQDFENFLEDRCFQRGRMDRQRILDDLRIASYDPLRIAEETAGVLAEDDQWLRFTYLEA